MTTPAALSPVATLDPHDGGHGHAPSHGHAHHHDHAHDEAHDHGHGSGHGHDGAVAQGRPHVHDAAEFAAPFSLVRASVGTRLAIAGLLSGLIWAAVAWARLPISG